MIINRSQTIRRIWRGGLYKPYGLNIPTPPPLVIIADIETVVECFERQGWTPVKRNAVTLYFPGVDAKLTLAQMNACDLDHLPGPLRVDARACIQAQGGCQ